MCSRQVVISLFKIQVQESNIYSKKMKKRPQNKEKLINKKQLDEVGDDQHGLILNKIISACLLTIST